MEMSVAVFLAIVVIILWAPHAIQNHTTFRNAVNLLLLSLALLMAAFAVSGLVGDSLSWFAQLLEFAGQCASAGSVALVLFAIMPNPPRSAKSGRSDDSTKDQTDQHGN